MSKFIPSATKSLEKLAARSTIIYRAMSLYYKELVKDEVSLANINSMDNVLCIGGGPCPFSGILLHEYTGAHVTIIDNDYSCVSIAKDLIQKLGYSDYITVLHMEGGDISPEDYNVIHMAVQINPIEKVFTLLKQGCSLGSKILVRLPKKTLTNFYSINDLEVFEDSSKKTYHSWRNVDSTALFVIG